MKIPLPPSEYDRPYAGTLTVIEKSLEDVHAACGAPIGLRVFACAEPRGEQCTIILPRVEKGGVTPYQYARLRRHEIGHCNGWGAHHPRPRWD